MAKGEIEMLGNLADQRQQMRRLFALFAVLAFVFVLFSAMVAASAAELYGVVSSGGKSQAGVEVELLSDQGSVATVQTSRRGSYRFRDIPPGNYRVRAAGQESNVYVGPGTNRFNIAK
jgi:hypothetical protein